MALQPPLGEFAAPRPSRLLVAKAEDYTTGPRNAFTDHDGIGRLVRAIGVQALPERRIGGRPAKSVGRLGATERLVAEHRKRN
jgi:hypothetical protein